MDPFLLHAEVSERLKQAENTRNVREARAAKSRKTGPAPRKVADYYVPASSLSPRDQAQLRALQFGSAV